MKINSGRSGTPYKAPGARKNMAEGGTAKRKVKLRKDGKLSDLSGKKADKIRAAAKAGETGDIKTGFLGLGKRYKIVQPEGGKTTTSSSSSAKKKAAAPTKSKRPPTKKTDPRSGVKVTKRSLGRGGKPSSQLDVKGATPTKSPHGASKTTKKKSARATQSDRGKYRRADEMEESTRARGSFGSNLKARVGKSDSPNKQDKTIAAYSKAEQARRKAGAKRTKTRGGTSTVDIDMIKTVGGKKKKTGPSGL